ncbi:HEAT repeat domain-containing protein [Kamptonema sp. UHCC 0994]|uniref:HEAT repeat domain-containing protein n=1 Tax=Kamptonema sp. UHCC 0994 TaxID=3031329 RepID=UPI0023B8E0EB|nr:HEAT repeat domain-containing protein [Kamptonema sp. UHCC 0994]MDF0556052.1 HEAT repeat domain-containing protein [Kamptonema sp. UHCC 0994]
MAHYRSSLCLLTCIVCLSFAPTPSRGGSDRSSTGLYNQIPTSASAADGTQGIIINSQAIVFAIASVAAQEPSPGQPKPTSTPNKGKPTPAPKQEKTNSSNSRIPKSVSAIIRVLLRQRSLFLLSLAAFLVTGAAVFILLKLVSSGESENLQRKVAIARKRKPQRNQLRNNSQDDPEEAVFPNTANGIYPPPYTSAIPRNRAINNSDRPSSSIVDPDDSESEAAIPDDNSGAFSPGNHSKSYSDPDVSFSEKFNPTEPFNHTANIFVEETSDPTKINLIDQLIKDLAHPHPTKRHKAIWELGYRGDSRAIGPLVNLLLNSDSKQHSLILSSLSEIGIKTLKPMNRAWLISLQNENAEVRKNAIRDLTRIYELFNQVSHLLQRAADDPDVEVQETARWALTQLNRNRPISGNDRPSRSNFTNLTDNNSDDS